MLNRYNRQYAGVVADGKREILVNGFERYPAPDPQWHWRMVLVFDGGFSFFHGVYNPTTRQMEQLQFNGPG